MGAAVEEDVPVWDRLSYDKDAVIEASAGTGKTYTLERIVLKLVLEKGIPLKKILLVTFTEKAAGELRDRIREAFEKELEGLDEADPASRDKEKTLARTLRHFDEATISTIHSFCQRMLGEYAFENGAPLKPELDSSACKLAERALREVLLSAGFQEKLGADAEALTEIVTNGASVEDLISSMASRLAAYRSPRLDCSVEEAEAPVDADRLVEAASALEEVFPGGSLFEWVQAGRLIHGGDLANAEADFARFEPLFPALLKPGAPGFPAALAAYRGLPKRSKYLNPRVRHCKDVKRVCDDHAELKEFIEALDGEVRRVRRVLLQELFTTALERMREIRRETATMSFDDIVIQAREVLFNDHDGLLLSKLRDAYQVALVDEFQDTDGIQWDIFRKIFSEAPKGDKPHSLIVVGDPKQAIYSFRGADLQAYLDARATIRKEGEEKTLGCSYRSTPALLGALNRLFGNQEETAPGSAETGWFAGTEVAYSPVKPPVENERFDDGPPPVPVELLESMPRYVAPTKKGFGNRVRCLPVFTRNAALEIKRLCAGGEGAFCIYDEHAEGKRRALRYGDFAFLVRNKSDSEPVKAALRHSGIPFSHYKEEGVYDSKEGEAVMALLELVADPASPGNRAAALLTSFFGVPVKKLDAILRSNIPSFTQLLDQWARLARDRRWARLFESFLEETRLWCPAGKEDPLYDRRYGTTRQILDDLLAVAGSTAQSVADLADALRKLRSGDREAGEDGKLRQKETEADRVQIMTMHASKGLEFPVVFIAYGFSPLFPPKYTVESCDAVFPAGEGAGREDRHRFHHMDGSPFKSDDPTGFYARKKELDASETRRLLYVALTRARYKLYLPWSARAGELPPGEEKNTPGKNGEGKPRGPARPQEPPRGIGSPGSALRGGFLCDAIEKLYPACNERVLDPAGDESAVAALEKDPSAKAAADEQGPVCLPDLPPGLRSRRVHWDSFSSIHHAAADAGTVAPGPEKQQALDGPEKEADEPVSVAGENEAAPAPRPALLPRGTASGTVFHELMEELCDGDGSVDRPGFEIGNIPAGELFAEGKGAVVLALAERLLRVHGLADREDEVSGDTTARTLVRMAWNALRAPIAIGETSLRLADLPPTDRRAEVNFVVDQQAILGEGPDRNGLFNGSIDLLFRLPGANRYFILDWKTNSLPSYGAADVSAAMDAANYHLQYQLYTLAASAWLGAGRLAGSAYLFVRGGEAGGDPPGIFARPYDEAADGDAYREDVARNLAIARSEEHTR